MICPLCEMNGNSLLYQRLDKRYKEREYWACWRCHLIYLDVSGHLTHDAEKERYDTHQNRSDDAAYVSFLNRLAVPLSQQLRSGFTGLDFGCGSSITMSLIFKDLGFRVESYDPFYHNQRELLANAYDFIVCSETVEHFNNPRVEFQLLNRLLKEDESYIGIMTRILPSESDFESWWYHRDPTHVSFYQYNTFEWIAQWLGWSICDYQENVVIFQKGTGFRDGKV